MNKQIKSENFAEYRTTLEVDKINQENSIIKQALVILGKRLAKEDLSATCAETVVNYLTVKVAELEHEIFGCLFLDNQHKLLKNKELFRGTIDGASVYPREVLKEALFYNAAAVIFYHNHPSGLCKSSQADDAITAKLCEVLNLVDIRVLDHIIIAGVSHYSYKTEGKL